MWCRSVGIRFSFFFQLLRECNCTSMSRCHGFGQLLCHWIGKVTSIITVVARKIAPLIFKKLLRKNNSNDNECEVQYFVLQWQVRISSSSSFYFILFAKQVGPSRSCRKCFSKKWETQKKLDRWVYETTLWVKRSTFFQLLQQRTWWITYLSNINLPCLLINRYDVLLMQKLQRAAPALFVFHTYL